MRRPWLALLVALALLAAAAVGCSSDPEGSNGATGATTIEAGGISWHAIVRGPTKAPLTVLFLHGAAFTSRVWDERGILDAVAEDGKRAVAVDLPGSGDTPARATDGPSARTPATEDTALRALVEELGGPTQVVVVSPSASGRYSLGYLAQFPTDPLAGFVAVAPVGIDDFERPADAAPVPALLVWGENDDVVPFANAETLAGQLPDSRIEQIPGAGHAAYDDDPESFLALLLPFLTSLSQS